MAQGEANFTSEGRTTKRISFEPAPTGVYTGKLLLGKAEVQKMDWDAYPVVGGIRIELQDTGKDGGANKSVFVNMKTAISPTQKGWVAWDAANGPQGLLSALGAKFAASGPVIKQYPELDKDGEPTGATLSVIDAAYFLKYLKQFEGRMVQLKVGIRKQKDKDPKNFVDYFVEPEEAVEAEDASSVEETTDSSWDEPTEEDAEIETAPIVKNGIAPHVAEATKKTATKGKTPPKRAHR